METNVRRRLVVQFVGIVLASLPTVAYAHGGNNDATVVHACIGNISRIVRIVGVSGACIASPPLVAETPAHWDIQGPAGINGTNGTNGVNGTNGTNGTDGTNGKDGRDGSNGIDGTSVTFVDYFSGNQHGCPNSGAIFAAGGVSAYVCNGVAGKDGQDAAHATPSWDQKLPCDTPDTCQRFVVLADWNGEAVLDRETGLVWTRSPNQGGIEEWERALTECLQYPYGGRGGWRVPSIVELMSLMNLPAGHPFIDVPHGVDFWSATSRAIRPDLAWVVSTEGGLFNLRKDSQAGNFWCVRGGMNSHEY